MGTGRPVETPERLLVARELGFEDLLIVTSIEQVKLNFGTDKEQDIHEDSRRKRGENHE